MSDDPFAGVTPIGDQRPRQFRLSARERAVRDIGDHAALRDTPSVDSGPLGDGTKLQERRRRVKLKPSMTVDEALAMAERMARMAFREATGKAVKPVDQKYAATKFGVAIDKWTMLSGRPTQIHEIRGEERAGVEDLARRLLGTGGAA